MPHARRRAATPRVAVSVTLLVVSALLASVAPASAGLAARWPEVETYYLGLLNCTRTGGWVRSDGSCDGRGSGEHSAERQRFERRRIVSREVARPYARVYAEAESTSHYLDGSPEQRFRRAGLDPSRWAENIGRATGDPFEAVLRVHRAFQAERSWGGGHWRNIKDARLRYVGIGVWRNDGMTYLVTDFYTP